MELESHFVRFVVFLVCSVTTIPIFTSAYLPNTAGIVLKPFIQRSLFGFGPLSAEQTTVLTYLWAAYIALNFVGTITGCLFATKLVDTIGRQKSLLLMCVLEVPAFLMQAFAYTLDLWQLMYIIGLRGRPILIAGLLSCWVGRYKLVKSENPFSFR